MLITRPNPAVGSLETPTEANRGALATVTTLFFMWGFLTSLNDVLIPHLKSIFALNYAEAMLVQVAFFTAYAVFGLPGTNRLSTDDGCWPAHYGDGRNHVHSRS
jgi:FHS family L-fucose permease-like MFS transporter